MIYLFPPLLVIGGIIRQNLFSLFYTIRHKDPEEAFFFFPRAQNDNRGFYSFLLYSIVPCDLTKSSRIGNLSKIPLMSSTCLMEGK